MFSSVRVRLTLWYTAVLACALVALALATYFVLRRNSARLTDAALVEMADSFLTTVRAETQDAPGPDSLKEAVREAIAEHKFRDTVFVVLDAEGKIIACSDSQIVPAGPSGTMPPTLADILHRSTREARPFRKIRLQDQVYSSFVREFCYWKGRVHAACFAIPSSPGGISEKCPLGFRAGHSTVDRAGEWWRIFSGTQEPVAGGRDGHTSRAHWSGQLAPASPGDKCPVMNSAIWPSPLIACSTGWISRSSNSGDLWPMHLTSCVLRWPFFAERRMWPCRSQVVRRRTTGTSLDILRAEAKRLKHIVEDLFTLARADAGQYPLTLTDFYLDELVTECSRSVRTLAAAKQITICCDTSKEMPIRADEALLRRMIVNLLDNAIKYTPPGGNVSVTWDVQDSQYRITVSDTGQGIPSELQSRIFERFFRVDKARSRSENDGGGAGLGLSISRWIVQAHAGQLELTRSDTSGSTFTVLLPATAI